MFIKNEISMYEFACAAAEVVDLAAPPLNNHHKRVACIACNIALEMNLPNDEIQEIILAAALHDIGVFSVEEWMKLHQASELPMAGVNRYAVQGYKLLKDFSPLAKTAHLIQYNHADFDLPEGSPINGSPTGGVPIGSSIIHLADRAAVLFDERREVLEQVPGILEEIMNQYHRFHPDVVNAFARLKKLEYVWIEAFSSSFGAATPKMVRFSKMIIDLETLRSFAQVIARIIDFRSRFTVTHSSGVAAIARELAVIFGFSERECEMLEIAGLLHDLGKLAVPNHILEKDGKLNDEEFNVIRKHSYYTYSALSRINGLDDIAVWAAYHHERQDGKGYPFHVKGEDFPRLARFMAVADMLAALTEERPYRPAMDWEKAAKMLSDTAINDGIDKAIVELANKNFPQINNACIKAQQQAQKEYEAFENDAVNLPQS